MKMTFVSRFFQTQRWQTDLVIRDGALILPQPCLW